MEEYKNSKDDLEKFARVLLEEQDKAQIDVRGEKMRRVLLLLAGGISLATVIATPGTARLFKDFYKNDSDWKEWKLFNEAYLRRTLKKLEKQKLVEVVETNDKAIVKIAGGGRRKILEANLNQMHIEKPSRWDGRWRLLLYDILDGKQSTRDHFRNLLKGLGFYPLQESVYLHAYPCGKEVEFLRHYLGIAGEVRLVLAEKIENDQLFRDYFGI